MATRSPFTAGPWTAEAQNAGDVFYGHYYIRDSDDQELASVHGQSADDALPNARLIAAAPDLYEALRKVLRAGGGALPFVEAGGSPNWAGDLRDALDNVADALTKADLR